MANYSDIKGFTVQTLSTDTIASQAAGGSWASGGSLNTARESTAGGGTQTAAFAAGGNPGTTSHEQYNGSSWTETTEFNQAKYGAASGGTTTASLVFGGYSTTYLATTETWNGSAWTEVNDLN